MIIHFNFEQDTRQCNLSSCWNRAMIAPRLSSAINHDNNGTCLRWEWDITYPLNGHISAIKVGVTSSFWVRGRSKANKLAISFLPFLLSMREQSTLKTFLIRSGNPSDTDRHALRYSQSTITHHSQMGQGFVFRGWISWWVDLSLSLTLNKFSKKLCLLGQDMSCLHVLKFLNWLQHVPPVSTVPHLEVRWLEQTEEF